MLLLYQGRLLVYVENTHTRCTPFFTSSLTVPIMTGSAFWHIQRLFCIWNFQASRTQLWVIRVLRDRTCHRKKNNFFNTKKLVYYYRSLCVGLTIIKICQNCVVNCYLIAKGIVRADPLDEISWLLCPSSLYMYPNKPKSHKLPLLFRNHFYEKCFAVKRISGLFKARKEQSNDRKLIHCINSVLVFAFLIIVSS